MSTIETFALPDLGEGLTDAELVRWEVAVGDVVELNQPIAEVETAKASVELPSPHAGTVVALHAAAGDTVDVGSPFIDFQIDADEQPARTPVLVGYGVAEEPTSRRRKRPVSQTPEGAVSQTPEGSDAPASAGDPAAHRPLASPPVRKSARDNGVDLADVPATGSHGEVTRADLNRHLESVAESDAAAAGPAARLAGEDRTPIRGVRKHTAEAMVRSAFTAPHVTEFVEIDVTPMMELVESLAAHRWFAGIRLTPLALVARAVVAAVRMNPSLNSAWDEQSQEIVTKHYVNLGIAAATPRGLMVPNIKDAQAMSLRGLAQALGDLTELAKEGKTPPPDLLGGTITITNIGVFGIDSGTPIINPGEAAIVCFGAVRRRPWEYEGQIALRQVTTLSVSFDHRLVDGEQGSRFLASVAEMLSDPLALIALG